MADSNRNLEGGFFSLSRKLFTHWLWTEKRVFSRAEAWIDLIGLARFGHEPDQAMIRGVLIEVSRGQLIHSTRTLAVRWQWSAATVSRFLRLLRNEEQIELEPVHGVQRITICNYERYQGLCNSGETAEKQRRNSGEASSTQEEERLEERKTPRHGSAASAMAMTEPIGPEAKRLGAMFCVCWEAIRKRALPGIMQPYADHFCQRALSEGYQADYIEDALVWLPTGHGIRGVPAIRYPRELEPKWFDGIHDARKRMAGDSVLGKQATEAKSYSLFGSQQGGNGNGW